MCDWWWKETEKWKEAFFVVLSRWPPVGERGRIRAALHTCPPFCMRLELLSRYEIFGSKLCLCKFAFVAVFGDGRSQAHGVSKWHKHDTEQQQKFWRYIGKRKCLRRHLWIGKSSDKSKFVSNIANRKFPFYMTSAAARHWQGCTPHIHLFLLIFI